jgi:hypothetical protein
MPWSRLRTFLTHWRTWTNVGGILLLAWFLLLLVRPEVVRELQSYLLANRHLLPLLPDGIATPRIVVESLTTLAPLSAVLILFLTLALAARPDEEIERERADESPDDRASSALESEDNEGQ